MYIYILYPFIYHIILTNVPSTWLGRPDSNLEFPLTGVPHQNPAAWEDISPSLGLQLAPRSLPTPSSILHCEELHVHFYWHLSPQIQALSISMPAPSLWSPLLSRTDHTSGSTPGRRGYRSCKQLRDNEFSGICYKKGKGSRLHVGFFPLCS